MQNNELKEAKMLCRAEGNQSQGIIFCGFFTVSDHIHIAHSPFSVDLCFVNAGQTTSLIRNHIYWKEYLSVLLNICDIEYKRLFSAG